jgi:hypothetical protein
MVTELMNQLLGSGSICFCTIAMERMTGKLTPQKIVANSNIRAALRRWG